MIALAAVIGVLVGIVMGSLGGGGAVLSVPILVFGFDLLPKDATTASLIIVGFGAVAGVLAHSRRGTVRWRDGIIFGLLGAPAAVLGSWLTSSIDPNWLLAAFAVLLLVVATLMLRRARKQVAETEQARGWPASVLAALGVGMLTGFFGVGGGFAMVPALVLVLGFRMPIAVGTSLLVMVMNTGSSLITRAVTGFGDLDWWLVGTFAVAAVVGNLLGGRVTERVSSDGLQRAFAYLLFIIAIYTGVRAGIALS